jgi:ATP-binding cassette subfamily F protein uup
VKRQERIDNYNAETDKVRNMLRRELEWIHATPCARTGKAKYRINAFHELKDRAEQVYSTKQVSIGPEVGQASRLGSKVINCKDVTFNYGDECYLSHFTYNFQRYEKVGIVGRNGVGKSTFLSLLTGDLAPTSGEIERGESLNIGYYRQEGMAFDETQTVLETVNDTRLLGQFLFTHDMLSNRISRLSGGEKRRLYLLTILMKQPNLLILDEPTNDLDIVTLNILEEYLKEFKGTLVIVSHDRHFLDRLVDHLFVLCGDGVVKDFIGGYSEYRSFMKDYEAEQRRAAEAQKKAAARPAPAAEPPKPSRRRLSWKEQRELEQLEKEMEELNAEKERIEALLSGGTASVDEIAGASARFGEVKDLLDEKEMRWLELSEIAEG